MQQTEKRGFSIIETSDAFSPQALNDNTRKIEAALDAHEAAVKEVTDALENRVVLLEGFKFAYGHYVGNGSTQIIQLPFTPVAVLVHLASQGASCAAVKGESSMNYLLQLLDSGFKVSHVGSNTTINFVTGIYYYFAFGTLD